MKKKIFAPTWKCTLFQVHIKEELITVKLSYGYAILKKTNGFWLLGTITYKPEKQDCRIPVNVFMHTPKYLDRYFVVGKKKIPLTFFTFKEKIIYFSNIPLGLMRKSHVKQMSV